MRLEITSKCPQCGRSVLQHTAVSHGTPGFQEFMSHDGAVFHFAVGLHTKDPSCYFVVDYVTLFDCDPSESVRDP